MIRNTKLKQAYIKRKRENARPRTLDDIDADLELTDCSLFRSLGNFVSESVNRETTIRLMKHLIVEQVIYAKSIDGLVMAYRWIVRDWSYKPSYEMYQAFLNEFAVASRIDPEYKEMYQIQAEEFKIVIGMTLKEKVCQMLAGESPTKGNRLEKRPRDSLPPIPEEDHDTAKEPRDQR